MRSLSPAYAQDWTPRIGGDAVNMYLAFKRNQRIGGILGVISWPVFFIGIGLGFVPVITVGIALLAFNFWVLFIRGRGQRALAVHYACQHIGVPAGATPPISGSPELFDIWESSRGYGGKAWTPKFGPRSRPGS